MIINNNIHHLELTIPHIVILKEEKKGKEKILSVLIKIKLTLEFQIIQSFQR